MSRSDVAALTVRLGEYNIKQSGETEIFETKAKRVVRHKDFTQQTLVGFSVSGYYSGFDRIFL